MLAVTSTGQAAEFNAHSLSQKALTDVAWSTRRQHALEKIHAPRLLLLRSVAKSPRCMVRPKALKRVMHPVRPASTDSCSDIDDQRLGQEKTIHVQS